MSPDLLELHYQQLIPLTKLSTAPEIAGEATTAIPILPDKAMQWPLHWSQGQVNQIALKLGTGGRINHCQLHFTLRQKQADHFVTVAKAVVDGAGVADNQWTEFILDCAVEPGHYWAELQSPEAKPTHAIFVWLTQAQPGMTTDLLNQPLDLSNYGFMPLIKRSFDAAPTVEPVKFLPLLRDKPLQWLVNWTDGEMIAQLLMRFGTCARINHCQLILTLLPAFQEGEPGEGLGEGQVIATAHLDGTKVVDHQWTELILNQPIAPGKYRCHISSPDADDHNTLFVELYCTRTQFKLLKDR